MKIGKSMKIVSFLLITLLLTLSAIQLAGCSKQITAVDGAGREITLDGVPKRIVSIAPAHTETIYELGLDDKLVGVSTWCNRPPEAMEKEIVGDTFSLNFEVLVALDPDIVFWVGQPDAAYVQDMERLNIPCYVSSPASVDQVFEDILGVAKVLGVEKRGQELISRLESELDDVLEDIEGNGPASNKPTAFIAIDATLWTVGNDSFMNEVLTYAGGVNIVDSPNSYLQLSMEELLTNQPDVIIVAIPEDEYPTLASLSGWSDLNAVKDGKVYFVNPDLISRPAPCVVEGIKEIAAVLRN